MTNDPAWATGGEAVYKRDQWVCRYCGLDGKQSFGAWQSLSWDHLLPRGHQQRDAVEFIVTACAPCNMMLSRYSAPAALVAGVVDPSVASELVSGRFEFLKPRLEERRAYWRRAVAEPKSSTA